LQHEAQLYLHERQEARQVPHVLLPGARREEQGRPAQRSLAGEHEPQAKADGMTMQPDAPTLTSLVLYVVGQLNELGRSPSTIQLVKYLYLIDVEHQRTIGRTLTGLDWVHYKFGPYAFELPTITQRLGLDLSVEDFTTNGYEGRAFRAERDTDFPEALRGAAKSIVDRVLKIWGLVATREILDYVYFHTEPMIETKQGEHLDFGRVQPDIGAYQLQFQESKKLREMRKRHAAPLANTGRVQQILAVPPDDVYIDAMNKLDNEAD